VLFILIFFVAMGLLLDLEAFGSLLSAIERPFMIVGTLLLAKLLASLGAQRLFHYSWAQTWTMWSLSIPQVAATLAAALVGYEAEIINSQVFNSIILLMLVTAILGPIVTARAARQLAGQEAIAETEVIDWLPWDWGRKSDRHTRRHTHFELGAALIVKYDFDVRNEAPVKLSRVVAGEKSKFRYAYRDTPFRLSTRFYAYVW